MLYSYYSAMMFPPNKVPYGLIRGKHLFSKKSFWGGGLSGVGAYSKIYYSSMK